MARSYIPVPAPELRKGSSITIQAREFVIRNYNGETMAISSVYLESVTHGGSGEIVVMSRDGLEELFRYMINQNLFDPDEFKKSDVELEDFDQLVDDHGVMHAADGSCCSSVIEETAE